MNNDYVNKLRQDVDMYYSRIYNTNLSSYQKNYYRAKIDGICHTMYVLGYKNMFDDIHMKWITKERKVN